MAKNAEFERTMDLSLEQAREVAASEAYLLTVDDPETSKLVISDAERTVNDDGSVHARVTAGKQKDDGTTGFTMEQSTDITPVENDQFVSTTVTPLPKGMGTMTTVLAFSRRDEGTTTVNAEVIAEVGIPLVGGKLAGKLIAGAEDSVDSGLERLQRLAGEV